MEKRVLAVMLSGFFVLQPGRNVWAAVLPEVPVNSFAQIENEEIDSIDRAREAHSLGTAVWEAMEETRAYIRSVDQNPAVGSEWNVIGLARGGMDLSDPYFDTYYNHFANYLEEKKGKLTTSIRYTEYSKAVVTMTAIGKDASRIGGYNLLEYLADLNRVTAQGINGPIWALIALDSSPQYVIPEKAGVGEQTTREKLLELILNSSLPEGGWDLQSQAADPDMTGMAIQALAPYYRKEGYEDVTAAIDSGLEALSRIQNEDGGFSTMGAKTSESCVQVVTALCALGIDPETDERFIKNGFWTVENLLTYHIPGSGFMHVKAGEGNNGGGIAGQVDGMATEQGYYALAAYQRLKEGKTSLYDMSDVELQEGPKGDGKGTGLEEPTPVPSPVPTSPSGSKNNTKSPSGKNSNYVVDQNAQTGNANGNAAGTAGAGSTVSGGSAAVGPSGSSAAPAASAAVKASAGQVSENKKKPENEERETGDGGWDFEAESYEEADGGWDFQGETVDVGNQEIEIAEEETKKKERRIPPLVSGMAGGMSGVAAWEGARFLWRRRKKKFSQQRSGQ